MKVVNDDSWPWWSRRRPTTPARSTRPSWAGAGPLELRRLPHHAPGRLRRVLAGAGCRAAGSPSTWPTWGASRNRSLSNDVTRILQDDSGVLDARGDPVGQGRGGLGVVCLGLLHVGPPIRCCATSASGWSSPASSAWTGPSTASSASYWECPTRTPSPRTSSTRRHWTPGGSARVGQAGRSSGPVSGGPAPASHRAVLLPRGSGPRPLRRAGTTAVAAVKTGRHYVGYDTDRTYISLSRARIKSQVTDPDSWSQSSNSMERLIVDPAGENPPAGHTHT